MKNNTIDIYVDFKSPYAFLAIEPSINFAKENKLNINWLPYVLEIPDFLGSAKVDSNGKVLENNRNDHQWRRVKYSYMDCRRYANTRNITVRGPQKIWNTKLISIALLWTKINNYEHTESFINYVFINFWKRELDIENIDIIIEVLKKIGINFYSFKDWANDDGEKELNLIINKAHKEGVFGVPSYVIKDELFWGREQLPMIKARLTDDYSKLI